MLLQPQRLLALAGAQTFVRPCCTRAQEISGDSRYNQLSRLSRVADPLFALLETAIFLSCSVV